MGNPERKYWLAELGTSVVLSELGVVKDDAGIESSYYMRAQHALEKIRKSGQVLGLCVTEKISFKSVFDIDNSEPSTYQEAEIKEYER